MASSSTSTLTKISCAPLQPALSRPEPPLTNAVPRSSPTPVVPIRRRLRSALLDPHRLRPRARELHRDERRVPRVRMARRRRRVPRHDLGDQLLAPRLSDPLHPLGGWTRLRSQVRHRRRQHSGLPPGALLCRDPPARDRHRRRRRSPRRVRYRMGLSQRAQRRLPRRRGPRDIRQGDRPPRRTHADPVRGPPPRDGFQGRGRELQVWLPRSQEGRERRRRPSGETRLDRLVSGGRREPVRLDARARLGARDVHLGAPRRVGPRDGRTPHPGLLPVVHGPRERGGAAARRVWAGLLARALAAVRARREEFPP